RATPPFVPAEPPAVHQWVKRPPSTGGGRGRRDRGATRRAAGGQHARTATVRSQYRRRTPRRASADRLDRAEQPFLVPDSTELAQRPERGGEQAADKEQEQLSGAGVERAQVAAVEHQQPYRDQGEHGDGDPNRRPDA